MNFKIQLTGECNFCGLCCVKDGFRCANLIITGEIGDPEATKCAVYDIRYDGMPIIMIDGNGNSKIGGKCWYRSDRETLEILDSGIGKGCSLTPEVRHG